MKIVNENKNEGEVSYEEAPVKWVLNLNDLSDEGVSGEKRADEDELRALTKMLNDEHDLEVRSLVCSYHIMPKKLVAQNNIDGYEGHFSLRADLQQTCVITLERIGTIVEEEFSQVFTSRGGHRLRAKADNDEVDDPFAEEPPMALLKGRARIGPLVYQYFSMAIDGNPRKPGVNFAQDEFRSTSADDKKPSPFAALKDFKDKT